MTKGKMLAKVVVIFIIIIIGLNFLPSFLSFLSEKWFRVKMKVSVIEIAICNEPFNVTVSMTLPAWKPFQFTFSMVLKKSLPTFKWFMLSPVVLDQRRHMACQAVAQGRGVLFFKKWANPGLFFIYFCPSKDIFPILQRIQLFEINCLWLPASDLI